jgi:hypothetical protein
VEGEKEKENERKKKEKKNDFPSELMEKNIPFAY